MAEGTDRRLDLSVAQVAGSALAAVTAAVLASRLGVYGTIIGAGVVSVVATAGGSVFQHFFTRTGQQLKGAASRAGRSGAGREEKSPGAPIPGGGGAAGSSVTAALRGPGPSEFGRPSVHGTRMRGWKRTALAATVVFGVAMGGLTAYEWVAGGAVGSSGASTTVGGLVGSKKGSGEGRQESPSKEPTHPPGPSSSRGAGGSGSGGSQSPVEPAPTPTGTGGQDGGRQSATPAPSASSESAGADSTPSSPSTSTSSSPSDPVPRAEQPTEPDSAPTG
ncbi:hypothetical protein [Streptomyces sp. NPDC006879]|uniref:hypothetical protein n=1 Tax=Streptomyces sp. NPDC006879 TaxID=3364767 RepID=UPI00368F5DCC